MIEILMLGGTGFLGTNIICEIFSLNRSDIKVEDSAKPLKSIKDIFAL